MTDADVALDFLAIVSRPTFPTGTAEVGDYYNLRALINRRPDWNAAVLELNCQATTVNWDTSGLTITQAGQPTIAVNQVRTALFLPICLEIEETLLHAVDPAGPWPRFEIEQWRPVSTVFEDHLSRLHMRSGGQCLNRPDRVRLTNNKLLQYEALTLAGYSLPSMVVGSTWPTQGPLSPAETLVAKNVSEGGWKSADEFSPARLVPREQRASVEPWPTIWQQPIVSANELRCYVMGWDLTVVELRRDPDIFDVRATNGGQPTGRIVDVPEAWSTMLVGMTRALGLDYAVIDAIPADDELHVLEVNANGVWWFLEPEIQQVLESRFHAWLEREVDSRRRVTAITPF